MSNKRVDLVETARRELTVYLQKHPSSSEFLSLYEEAKENENELLELPPEGPPDHYFVWYGCPCCGGVNVLTGLSFRNNCLISCAKCGARIINDAPKYGTAGTCYACPQRVMCLAHSPIKRDEICMTIRLR